MPTMEFGRIDSDVSKEEIIEYIAKMQKALDYLMQGGLDSKNAREFGGWLVRLDKLMSKDGDVGMSTEDTAADDIRFWAGDAIDGNPKFKVTKSGILTAIAAMFMSAAGYPRVEMNSQTGEIAAYQAANNYTKLSPDASGSTPGLHFHNPSANALVYLLGTTFALLTSAGTTDIQISAGKNLELFAGTGSKVKFENWNFVQNNFTGRTLEQDLNSKANGSGVSGAFTSGTGQTIVVNNGVITAII